ncbi:MAG: hypothetical protein ACUVSQ_13050 [Pseudanabaenaceae cyanobacterium]
MAAGLRYGPARWSSRGGGGVGQNLEGDRRVLEIGIQRQGLLVVMPGLGDFLLVLMNPAQVKMHLR